MYVCVRDRENRERVRDDDAMKHGEDRGDVVVESQFSPSVAVKSILVR